MVALRPYPHGFAIFRSDANPTLPEEWSTVPLGHSDWIFAHDSHAAPEFIAVGDGDRWALVHGLCLYAGDDQRDLTPAHRVAQAMMSGHGTLLDLLDVLGGRHVVLVGDDHGFTLYQDATGMRSVYFSQAAAMVSSHALFLNELHPHPRRTPAQGLHGFMRAWDRTPLIGIDALLPNHALSIPRFEISRFFPRAENRYSEWTVQERLDEYRVLWERQWNQLSRHGHDMIMSLTGGQDSRTSLAMLADHMDSIRTFTYTAPGATATEWGKSLQRDKEIVEQIKRCIDVDHRYLTMVQHGPAVTQDVTALLERNSIGNHGQWLLPYYLREFGNENTIHIRGNIYGLYKSPWGAHEDNDTMRGLREGYNRLTQADAQYESRSSREQHFTQGAERWEYIQDQHGFHRLELLYWEIRLGRWATEIYNETDVAFSTFDPTNLRRLIECALSFSIPHKKSKVFQSELINASYPLLNFPGINNTRNLYEQTRSGADEEIQLHESESGVDIEPAITVNVGEASDEFQISLVSNSTLYIPAANFVPGTTSSLKFVPVKANGSMTFAVDSPYSNRAARGSWYYQLTIDDVTYARWDGALRRRPTHVTLSNLTPENRVELQAVALRNRRDMLSWEHATRAKVTDAVFTEGPITGGPSVSTDHPGSVLESTPELISIDLENLDRLSLNDFTLDHPQRLNVVTKFCVIPLLVVRRPHAERTVIMCNGAVDISVSGGDPVFQRSSWWRDIPHHQIFVCDPATTGDDSVSIAWGQYSAAYWIVPDVARIATTLSKILTSDDNSRRLYFGSSAGGFLAMAMHLRDPDSRAIVNNAQFDWTTWYPSAVQTLISRRLDSKQTATLRGRTNVLDMIASQGIPPRIDYWVNTALTHDRQVSLPQLERFMVQQPTLTAGISVHQYLDDASGHAPLPKEKLLAILDLPGDDGADH